MTEISAKTGDGKSAVINYEFGEGLDASVALFGAEAVHSCFVSDGKVSIQAGMRRLLTAGKTQEEVQAYFDTYKIGVKAAPVSVDPVQRLLSKFATMDATEQADLLNKLREAAKAKK